MIIRTAKEKDIRELLEIYNFEVNNGVSTLDINEKSLQQWQEWFYRHNIKNHPLIVAEEKGRAVGYASLSSYREKEAYCSTVELSVYVHGDFRGMGIGKALMKDILQRARNDDSIHTVVSVITTGNAASEELHKSFGFTFSGTIKEVGVKFGRYLDISNYYLQV